MDEKTKQFVNGLLVDPRAPDFLASHPEKVTAAIEMMENCIPHLYDLISENCREIMITARINGEITTRQFAWFQREIKKYVNQ